MNSYQDLFISHASADKEEYIYPLADALTQRKITFWLDKNEITWGDNFVSTINHGLKEARFTLLCLSKNFIQKPWPEMEMTAILAIQTTNKIKRVLPLILNSKHEVFNQYPLLKGLSYREYNQGLSNIVNEIAKILDMKELSAKRLDIIVEGVHTGKLCNLNVSEDVSIQWLIEKAQASLDAPTALSIGPVSRFYIRWILVDVECEEEWASIPRSEQRKIYCIFRINGEIKKSFSRTDRIRTLGIKSGATFHLYAIEDESFPLGVAVAAAEAYDTGTTHFQ